MYLFTVFSQITISLNQIIQAIGELEMNIISVERVDEYARLEPEVSLESYITL